MCHAAETYWPGVPHAGKHVTLEHAPQVAEAAREIYLHSGLSTSMPPGNATFMTPQERALIVAWYRGTLP